MVVNRTEVGYNPYLTIRPSPVLYQSTIRSLAEMTSAWKEESAAKHSCRYLKAKNGKFIRNFIEQKVIKQDLSCLSQWGRARYNRVKTNLQVAFFSNCAARCTPYTPRCLRGLEAYRVNLAVHTLKNMTCRLVLS